MKFVANIWSNKSVLFDLLCQAPSPHGFKHCCSDETFVKHNVLHYNANKEHCLLSHQICHKKDPFLKRISYFFLNNHLSFVVILLKRSAIKPSYNDQ